MQVIAKPKKLNHPVTLLLEVTLLTQKPLKALQGMSFEKVGSLNRSMDFAVPRNSRNAGTPTGYEIQKSWKFKFWVLSGHTGPKSWR
jgi:hypothetical protein